MNYFDLNAHEPLEVGRITSKGVLETPQAWHIDTVRTLALSWAHTDWYPVFAAQEAQ